jgi:hypothetical protein
LSKARRLLLLLALLAAASAVAGASPASAATELFAFTGATQQWIVPAGVTSATFDVFGASGGPNSAASIGGKGGEAKTTIAVTPGETIFINVGSAGVIPVGPSAGLGGSNPASGYGGSGGSSVGATAHGGGTGGGSSDVRQGGNALTDRVLVAGGGGGAGGTSCDACGTLAAGGDGGDTETNGADGLRSPDDPVAADYYAGCGGGGATGSGGGAAGTQVTNVCGLNSPSGAQGGSGSGGSGGSPAGGAGGGGGGGGGYYGGGGGGGGGPASGGGGGGGGSNFGPVGAVLTSGVNLGDGSVSITYDGVAATATVTPTPMLTPVAKSNCDAGKAKCVDAKQACLLKLYSSSEKQGAPPDPAQLQKCRDKFDAGTKGFAAGCIGKLESKQDPKKPKTVCSVTGDLVVLEGKVDAFVTDGMSEIDPSFPALGASSACNAGKTACVSNKASCLMKAHQAAEKQGAPPDPAQLQKCRDKFDGGTKGFAAGCIGKLESKQDPKKPKTICSVTGDLVVLEGKVDAFVTDIVNEIQSTP